MGFFPFWVDCVFLVDEAGKLVSFVYAISGGDWGKGKERKSKDQPHGYG